MPFSARREEEGMSRLHIVAITAAVLAGLLVTSTVAFAQGGPRPRPDTWVDGERFAGVVTPATFDPANGNFDELYMCTDGTTFKDGVPLISESGPGDQDYNGGRWHLNVSTNCDPTADSVEDLNLSAFTSTDMYFECPLLPRRGAG
jgi:hypothetical protein